MLNHDSKLKMKVQQQGSQIMACLIIMQIVFPFQLKLVLKIPLIDEKEQRIGSRVSGASDGGHYPQNRQLSKSRT